jgi:hypothetical protein
VLRSYYLDDGVEGPHVISVSQRQYQAHKIASMVKNGESLSRLAINITTPTCKPELGTNVYPSPMP